MMSQAQMLGTRVVVSIVRCLSDNYVWFALESVPLWTTLLKLRLFGLRLFLFHIPPVIYQY